MTLQSRTLVHVSVQMVPNGPLVRIPDPFDKRTGGDVSSSETKHKPGGMAPERSWTGTATVSNVTVTRQKLPERDADLIRRLRSRVGRAARMQVVEYALNAEGEPIGEPDKWAGYLLSVNAPDADSGSESPANYDLVLSTEGTVS